MWARLIAVKRHRENRLRTEINDINEQIHNLNARIERLDQERTEVMETWRKRSEEQSVRKEDKLNELRRELSGYHTEAARLQQERAQEQANLEEWKQQRNELNEKLRLCITKQEKLQLLQKEHDEQHRPDPRQ